MEELVLAVAGGAAILTLTAALWLPLRDRETVLRRRMAGFVEAGSGKPGALAVDLGGRRRRRVTPSMPGDGQGSLALGIERRIAKAQLDLTVREFVLGTTAATVAVFVLGAAVTGAGTAFALAAVVPLLAYLWLAQRAARIQRRFSDQLADSVALLASSVRTGHSVQQALEHVSKEAPEPTRSAFAVPVREIGLGASQEDALSRLVERYPSEDMELVTTAINVHSAIGGSLAHVLDSAADTIRERTRMAAEVKALTAQQRYSAYVLALLPVFTLFGLKLISPDYVDELFKPGGLRIALGAAGMSVMTGFWVMRKMSQVDG